MWGNPYLPYNSGWINQHLFTKINIAVHRNEHFFVKTKHFFLLLLYIVSWVILRGKTVFWLIFFLFLLITRIFWQFLWKKMSVYLLIEICFLLFDLDQMGKYSCTIQRKRQSPIHKILPPMLNATCCNETCSPFPLSSQMSFY